jgi:lactate dehydrogenase-like 2-hydroxyacid dehydrogenase
VQQRDGRAGGGQELRAVRPGNVLVTPHMAGFSVEADEKSRIFALENTIKVARGEEPESVVPPD